MAAEDILVDNLKEALKSSHNYIVLGTSTALFLLILVIQELQGTVINADVKVPLIELSTGRSMAKLTAVVACFISGYMAYLAVSRIHRIRWRLRAWQDIRKAALTFPSIPTTNMAFVRVGAILLPALLYSAALVIIFRPWLKDKDMLVPAIFLILMLNLPYILLIQQLIHPLGETNYKLTKESLETLKKEGVSEEILEKLKAMIDEDYKNRPRFLNALSEKVGEIKDSKTRRLILNCASDEEGIED